MGNLCGKESGPKQSPGRVLGSAPSSSTRPIAQTPAGGRTVGGTGKKPKAGGPGRTLGGSQSDGEQLSAAEAAREAAERRAQAEEAKANKGPLHARLAEEKKKTPTQTQPRKNELADPSAWA